MGISRTSAGEDARAQPPRRTRRRITPPSSTPLRRPMLLIDRGCGRSGGAGAAIWMLRTRPRRSRGVVIRRHFRRDVAGPADAVALMIGKQLLGAHGPRFEIAQHAIHQGGQRRCAGDRLCRMQASRAIIGAGRPTCLGTRRRGGFNAEIRRGSAVHSLLPFKRRWRVRPSLVLTHRRRPQSGSGQPEARSP